MEGLREPQQEQRRFFIGTNCHVACVDRDSGELVWQTAIHASVSSFMVSLLHYKDLLFASCRERACCLAVADGRILWQTKLHGLGEPVAMALDPGAEGGQLLLGGGGRLYSVAASDGKLQWQNELPGLGYHPITLRAPGLITCSPSLSRYGKLLLQHDSEQHPG
jgi:outer membrane protein assembly factor BamB